MSIASTNAMYKTAETLRLVAAKLNEEATNWEKLGKHLYDANEAGKKSGVKGINRSIPYISQSSDLEIFLCDQALKREKEIKSITSW